MTFMWRWYDQSKALSIQPDMNIMAVELIGNDTVVRSAGDSYED